MIYHLYFTNNSQIVGFFFAFPIDLAPVTHRGHLKSTTSLTQNLYTLIEFHSPLCSSNLFRLKRNITYKPKISKDSWNLFFKLCVRKFIEGQRKPLKEK